MKTIGLLGGMSWESTALYYRRINEAVRDRLGGLHSARIAMISVDFALRRKRNRMKIASTPPIRAVFFTSRMLLSMNRDRSATS